MDMDIVVALLAIAAGLVGLVWSADRFVLGASTTASNLGVTPIVIGLTIVAFGTSAPEIFSSAVASLKDSPGLAVGNVLGSNIANLGLVLAITALVRPLLVPPTLRRKELPALLLISGLAFFIFANGWLGWLDGLALLAALGLFAWRLILPKIRAGAGEDDESADYIKPMSTPRALLWMVVGLAVLLLSSNVLVDGARTVAAALGVPELVIGLTIVAIGTSLPELATCIASALKGQHQLAVGNIVGSNIFNLLLVLPVPAFLSPVGLGDLLLWRDYGAMMLITGLFAAAVYWKGGARRPLGRLLGMVLLLLYFAYTALLFFSTPLATA